MTTNLILTRIFDNEPLPRHKLTVETLAQGLKRAVSDAQIKQHAAALGAKIRRWYSAGGEAN